MADFVESQCCDCGVFIFLEDSGELKTSQCTTCKRQCKESAEHNEKKSIDEELYSKQRQGF